MEISRRDFLKLSGAGIGTAVVSSFNPGAKVAATPIDSPVIKAVLYDSTICIGCKLCETTCSQYNRLPEESSYTKIYIHEAEDGSSKTYSKHQCLHCLEPACAEICIVGALQKTSDGPVVYDENKCIGCRYCMVACPFGVPTFEWDKTTPLIRKCTFCSERLAKDLEPACVAACPTDALRFGVLNELIEEARERISASPDKYVDHIYGEKENGGTSWLYLSPVSFEKLGLPMPGPNPVVANVRHAMAAVLPALIAVAATMTGFYWLTRRRGKSKTQNKEEVKK